MGTEFKLDGTSGYIIKMQLNIGHELISMVRRSELRRANICFIACVANEGSDRPVLLSLLSDQSLRCSHEAFHRMRHFHKRIFNRFCHIATHKLICIFTDRTAPRKDFSPHGSLRMRVENVLSLCTSINQKMF